MAATNVLRMDDFLLQGAGVLALFVACAGAVWLGVPEEAPLVRTALGLGVCGGALAPVAMLVVGLHLRQRELRAQALLRLIDHQPELAAADLLRSSDFSDATLDRAVRDLNSSGVRHVVWDRERGLVQDGALRQARLHIETCRSCGAKISLEVPLYEAASASCPSCGSSLDARDIEQEKQTVIAELRREAAPERPSLRPARRFSLPLFLLLLFLCWPAAVIYGAMCWRPSARDEVARCA